MHFLDPFHLTRLLAPLLCRGCPLHAAAEHLQAVWNVKRIWLRFATQTVLMPNQICIRIICKSLTFKSKYVTYNGSQLVSNLQKWSQWHGSDRYLAAVVRYQWYLKALICIVLQRRGRICAGTPRTFVAQGQRCRSASVQDRDRAKLLSNCILLNIAFV